MRFRFSIASMMAAILIVALSFTALQMNSVLGGEIILLATLALLSGAIFMSLAESRPNRLIAWVMVAVAIAAFDFMAIRAVLVPQTSSLSPERGFLLLLGALPMANVLAVGLLVVQLRPGVRPFLQGFEAFGAMALAHFILLASCFPREVVIPYLVRFFEPVEWVAGRHNPFVSIPIQCLVSVIMLGLPQVAFALLGGSLSRRFKVRISRR